MRWLRAARLGAYAILISFAAACSPRYSVFRVDTPGTSQLVEGLPTRFDSLVEVGLDFWSPGGAPYVTLRNHSDEPLLLDLYDSGMRLHERRAGWELLSFATYLGGDAPTAGLRTHYPELPTVRRDGKLYLEIAPGEWQGLEGPPLVLSPNPNGGDRNAIGDPPRHIASLVLTLRSGADTSSHRIVQGAYGILEDHLFKQELAEFEQGRTDLGRYYFLDRHVDRDEMLQALLVAASAF